MIGKQTNVVTHIRPLVHRLDEGSVVAVEQILRTRVALEEAARNILGDATWRRARGNYLHETSGE